MDQEKKGELLGVVRPRIAEGGHVPDLKKLQSPFEEVGTVCRIFCTGCNAYLEFDLEGVEYIQKKKLNEALEGKYLECLRCMCCDRAFKEVTTKYLPS